MKNIDSQEIYTSEQLSNWGLLPKVKRELLVDNFTNEVDPPTQKVFEEVRKIWLTELGIKSEDELKTWEKQQRLTRKEWQIMLIRRWKWLQWCRINLEDKIATHYLRRKPELDQVIYSLLRVKDEYLANELFLRIKNEENSFEDICKKYSEGPEKQTGGKIGPVPLSQPHPLLAKLLQVSNINQLWSPKQLGDWWIIVKMNKLICTELNEALKDRLLLELGEELLITTLQKDLKENSKILNEKAKKIS